MAISEQDNQLLTQVGPGTPGGEMLRRYWQPIAVSKELTEDKPTKFIRALGEDLVLFLDKSGRVGLIGDRCPHRGASMLYGRVEKRGIACAYHGWLIDANGRVLETPPEKHDAICRNVQHKAYPVIQRVGLYWAYMGPLPAPEFPPYDTLMRRDGERKIIVHPRLDCNWLQAMENAVDPAHLQLLHQEFIGRGRMPEDTTRGFIDEVESVDFTANEIGLMKRRVYRNGLTDEHPLIFPNILRQGPSTQIRMPIDDTHTWHVFVVFEPDASGRTLIADENDVSVEYRPDYKSPGDALYPEAHYTMASVIAQDHMAWETQGAIADRTAENLASSDRGIIMFRNMVRENIKRVQDGLDPLGVIRDPQHPMIDTNIDESLAVEKRGHAKNPATETLDKVPY